MCVCMCVCKIVYNLIRNICNTHFVIVIFVVAVDAAAAADGALGWISV